MYSQFLESKLDYPSHLMDWQERQNKSRLSAGSPATRRSIRAWLVYPADALIQLGLLMKKYAARESELTNAEVIRSLGC